MSKTREPRVCTLIVTLKGKVSVIRAKEVTCRVPDFGEENSTQSKDESDNNSVGNQNRVDAENNDDDEVILDSFQSHVNEVSNVKGDANEANYVERTQEQPYVPYRDPFGLEYIVLKSSKKYTKVAQETNSTEPKFPLENAANKVTHKGFPSPASKQVGILSTRVSLKRELWSYMAGIINHWHGEEQDFSSIIEYYWNNDGVYASNAMVLLKNKLKFLKQRLKMWSKDKKSIMKHDRKALQDSLIDLDMCLDKGEGLPDDLSSRTKLLHDLQAFDSVRWDHLDDILGKFSFGNKWRGWIRGFLISSKASVLVNGSPTDEFSFHRGLNQVDPLSNFLFILVMESLHVSFHRLIDRANNLPFTYLGINVCAYMSRVNTWNEVVLKVFIKNVIKAIRGNNGSIDMPFKSRVRGSVWIKVLKSIAKPKDKGVDLIEFYNLVIGNRNISKIWLEKWRGDVCFKDKFHMLCNLETHKDSTLACKFQTSYLSFSFRRRPRSSVEESQFLELSQSVF
nr:cysteine-rich receptor-like protein kinase [Tanacetum cinerariifolium]